MRPSTNTQRRGTVLIAAMVVIFVLVSMVMILAQRVGVEATASANDTASAEARAVARGAEQYVLGLLTEGTEPIESLDESAFEAVPMGRGYFWLVRPDYREPTLPRFGLIDESAKLDINQATPQVLARLPGLTDEIAAAIKDWRDADDDVTDGGAESQTYLQKSRPYRAKNEPFETVEELLLVQGMTRELLYGQREQSSTGGPGDFESELYQSIGEFDFLTVWGKEPAATPDGTPRLNPNTQQTRGEFEAMLKAQLGDTRGEQVMAAVRGTREPFENVLEFAVRTGLKSDELVTLEPLLVVQRPSQGGQAAIPRMYVNINTAPREVLLTLEGLSETDADTLIARRPVSGTAVTNPGSIAWVLDAFGEPQRVQQKLIDLGNQVVGRGGAYSADIVAVSGNGRSFQRVRIVVDTTGTAPRIVYRRDITARGWPLDPEILHTLREGGIL